MDDPSSIVSSKAEPSATQVNVEQVAGSNITFAQALQTVQETDVRCYTASLHHVASSAHAIHGRNRVVYRAISSLQPNVET